MAVQLVRTRVLESAEMATLWSGEPVRLARLTLAAAQRNEVEAQALLGQLFLEGRGIPQDLVLARQCFAIAARRGHALAQNMLGRCLEHGWGGALELSGAAVAYAAAAQQELDWGCYNLANLLATGRGVKADPVRAFQLYRQAARTGHAKSMNLLGRCLEEGLGCERDLIQACTWYRRSAEAGDFRGQFSYGSWLAGEGKRSQARFWLGEALRLGHSGFLARAGNQLLQANQPWLQTLGRAYLQRAELGQQTPVAVQLPHQAPHHGRGASPSA